MDPEIQPLANKVNKIEQKLEEQEQRIELLEHEEAVMEQKLAMEEIINPAETILTDHGDGLPIEPAPAVSQENMAVIQHDADFDWSVWLTKKNIAIGLAIIFGLAFLIPFFTGFGPGSLMVPTFILVLDIAIIALTLFIRWLWLPLLAIIGTVIVYLNWFFASEPGVVNPDLLISFLFVAGYFVILSIAPAIKIFGQKAKLVAGDVALVAFNSFLLFTAIYFLFRDTFVGSLSFFAIVLLLGNGGLIGYYFYQQNNLKKVSHEDSEEEEEEEEEEDEENNEEEI